MQRATVFMVDPDPDELDRLDEVLTDAGYSPVLWSSCVVPQALLDDIRPALILFDLDLPLTAGERDLLAQIRSSPSTQTTPLIVTTATPHAIPDALLVAWQPVQVLPRPVDPAALVMAVRHAVVAHAAAARIHNAVTAVAGYRMSPRHRRDWPSPEPIEPPAGHAGPHPSDVWPGGSP